MYVKISNEEGCDGHLAGLHVQVRVDVSLYVGLYETMQVTWLHVAGFSYDVLSFK